MEYSCFLPVISHLSHGVVARGLEANPEHRGGDGENRGDPKLSPRPQPARGQEEKQHVKPDDDVEDSLHAGPDFGPVEYD